jgi:hypothetical protein
VRIKGLPPCDIHLWGEDVDGQWWALVSWREADGDPRANRLFSVWAPARLVGQSQRPEARRAYGELPWMLLPGQRDEWPPPSAELAAAPRHLGAADDPAASAACAASTSRPL